MPGGVSVDGTIAEEEEEDVGGEEGTSSQATRRSVTVAPSETLVTESNNTIPNNTTTATSVAGGGDEEEEDSVEDQTETIRNVPEVSKRTRASSRVTQHSQDTQDVEMAEESVADDTTRQSVDDEGSRTIASEMNSTIPETPEKSQITINTNTTVGNTTTEQTLTNTVVEQDATMITPPQKTITDQDDGQETDCSLSSFKENQTQESVNTSARRRGRPAKTTAIPRRVADAPVNEGKVEERRLRQVKTGSKIPVISSQQRNKRALDRSTTMMTPDVKQKRTEADPNVRKRQMGARQVQSTTLQAPRTPTRTAVNAGKTKSTSTPINDSVLMTSRVVLSPLDMSEINKTRATTRSAKLVSQRALRTRNVK